MKPSCLIHDEQVAAADDGEPLDALLSVVGYTPPGNSALAQSLGVCCDQRSSTARRSSDISVTSAAAATEATGAVVSGAGGAAAVAAASEACVR